MPYPVDRDIDMIDSDGNCWTQTARYTEVRQQHEVLEMRIAALRLALHRISLCSQDSMSSIRNCGELARKALAESKEWVAQ